MKHTKLMKATLILFISNVVSAAYRDRLCTTTPKKLKLYDTGKDIDYDTLNAFVNGLRKLGEGSYGLVKEARWIDNSSVAIKQIKFNPRDTDEIAHLEGELEALDALNKYSFLPKFIGCTLTNNVLYLVMELLKGQTLIKSSFPYKLKTASPAEAMSHLIKVFEPIYLMNKEKFVHNDIKPDNMMFDSTTKQLSYIDFGTANKLNYSKREAKGTPYFISLNRLQKGPYTTHDDLFSTVISLAEAYSTIQDVYSVCLKHYGRDANVEQFFGNRLRDTSCKTAIPQNLKRIFSSYSYLTSKSDQGRNPMSLATLFVRIASDDPFTLSIDEVMDIIYNNAAAYGIERPADNEFLRARQNAQSVEEPVDLNPNQGRMDDAAQNFGRPNNLEQKDQIPRGNYQRPVSNYRAGREQPLLLNPGQQGVQNLGYRPSHVGHPSQDYQKVHEINKHGGAANGPRIGRPNTPANDYNPVRSKSIPAPEKQANQLPVNQPGLGAAHPAGIPRYNYQAGAQKPNIPRPAGRPTAYNEAYGQPQPYARAAGVPSNQLRGAPRFRRLVI